MKKKLVTYLLLALFPLTLCACDDDDDDDEITTSTGATATAPSGGATREDGAYHGRGNGNRPLWYFSKKMASYPSTIYLTVPGCGYDHVSVTHNGKRYEVGGILFKQSDVSGRGMALHVAASCGSRSAYIEY
ncbi:MAG: hypothetical protein LBU39_06305 [Desulfobulbaceae bacterium]|jgi:hypothetical protein|nr:hypothetical protein [Desulfobulbaceae bacterium]